VSVRSASLLQSCRTEIWLALHYNPATIIGIDADEKLIQKAKSHLSFRWSRLGPNGEIDYFPASSVEAAGHIPYARNDKSQLPSKVLFHRSGFLECDPIPFPETASVDGNDGARFGVVMMLSVIKWIHLEHGDKGMFAVPWEKEDINLLDRRGSGVSQSIEYATRGWLLCF
jgi:7SK snRNA methylphosphate capping enzyme